MVIVDSAVWIDYFGGVDNAHTTWLEREMGSQPLGLVDLILCEVLQGIREKRRFNQAREDLLKFDVFETSGAELAISTAENYRFLRSQGVTVRKTIDSFIATFCLREGYSLLHRDRDFDAFETHLQLKVVHVAKM